MKNIQLFFILICFNSLGQRNIVVAGNTIENSTGSFSFTVGQIDNLPSQGIQQPYLDINVIEDHDKSLLVLIYPNPTTNDFLLQISDVEKGIFSFDLYDSSSKLIASKEINSPLVKYSLEGQEAALYFLTIKQNNTTVKQFKIVKAN